MRRFQLLAVLWGLLVIAGLILSLGWAQIAAQLRHIGPGFSWVLGAYLATLLIYSLPLGLLLPMRPSLRALVASRCAAVSVNAATPLLGIGGEPVRLLWLAPEMRARGAAALVIDRSAFYVASALFLTFGVAAATRFSRLPRFAIELLTAIGLATILLTLALLLLERRHGVLLPIARLVGHLAPRRRLQLEQRANELDAIIRHFHHQRPGRFSAAVALHLAGRLLSVLEILAVSRLLHLGLDLSGGLVFAALPLLVDLAFGLIPSQLGVHEGSTALLATLVGLEPAAGLALAFVLRLRQVVFVALGFTLLGLRRHKRALVAVS